MLRLRAGEVLLDKFVLHFLHLAFGFRDVGIFETAGAVVVVFACQYPPKLLRLHRGVPFALHCVIFEIYPSFRAFFRVDSPILVLGGDFVGDSFGKYLVHFRERPVVVIGAVGEDSEIVTDEVFPSIFENVVVFLSGLMNHEPCREAFANVFKSFEVYYGF